MGSDYYDGMLGDIGNRTTKAMFECALDRWTERPQLGDGYNKRTLELYDALIWTRVENAREGLKRIKGFIKDRDDARENSNRLSKLLVPATDDGLLLKLNEINEDIKNWKYTGRVYRVINCKKCKVEYHRLIASWVSDTKAFESFNHLYKNSRNTFLIGETVRDWAFDVNKYRNNTKNRHCYTEHESEIIFPMDKRCIVDLFYRTLEEFYGHIETRRS